MVKGSLTWKLGTTLYKHVVAKQGWRRGRGDGSLMRVVFGEGFIHTETRNHTVQTCGLQTFGGSLMQVVFGYGFRCMHRCSMCSARGTQVVSEVRDRN